MMGYWRGGLLPERPRGAQTLTWAGGGDLWDAIATEQVGFGHETPRVPWRGACLRGRRGGRPPRPLKQARRGEPAEDVGGSGSSGVWDPTGKSEIFKFKRRLPRGEEEEGG